MPDDEVTELYGDVLAAGALCGEYVVEKHIAMGGFGHVYQAVHRVIGRRAAVKVLHREKAGDPITVQRFVREARAVNVIRHPNIADIHEFGQLPDGRPYHIMELVEGSSLRVFLEARGRLGARETMELLAPVAAALQAAHEVGVVHRDLKASNIMVGGAGLRPVEEVKLLDFGIAKLIHPGGGGSALTSVHELLGTPANMAPEQFRGEPVDARTDVYAFGLLLYQCLTGHLPFEGEAVEIRRQHLEAPPPSPGAHVPPAVTLVVLRCLQKDPAQRYPSIAAAHEALAEAIAGPRARVEGRLATRLAAGAYVEVRIRGVGDELDDALLDDMAFVMEQAEARLGGAGCALPLQTATAVLGVLVLSEASEQERRQLERLAAAAIALRAELDGRLDERVHVNVCLHMDQALVRQRPDGADVLGGPLLRLEGWAPSGDEPGVCASPALAARAPYLKGLAGPAPSASD